MKLWSGRFTGSVDELASKLNDSIQFDQRLYEVDVLGSMAWAKCLMKADLLSADEYDEIVSGLKMVQDEFDNDQFILQESDEDIHTAVERRLTELIGAAAGKLHTGRSRNDQVATDFRLWTLSAIRDIQQSIRGLQGALFNRAENDLGIIMPGYTHFQQAQPILLSHWWLSYFWMFQRDFHRLDNLYQMTNEMPLGCGALAGTGFVVDRFALADDLGFNMPSQNSLDAVSDRDFAAEFLFCISMMGIHLSKLAESLILYSTHEYGFIELADEYSTGSSLMPQKKNPDPLELARGKSGYFVGRLTGLLTTLKGLPSAYDKDLQEDKPPVFEAFDTIILLLPVISGLLDTLTVKKARMVETVNLQLLATDLADYLVEKGIPFREAHGYIGQAVRLAEERDISLKDISLGDWKAISPVFADDLYNVFDLSYSIERRASWGGTATKMVAEQIKQVKNILK